MPCLMRLFYLVFPKFYNFLEFLFKVAVVEKKGLVASAYGFFSFAQLRGLNQCGYVQFLFYFFFISQESIFLEFQMSVNKYCIWERKVCC